MSHEALLAQVLTVVRCNDHDSLVQRATPFQLVEQAAQRVIEECK